MISVDLVLHWRGSADQGAHQVSSRKFEPRQCPHVARVCFLCAGTCATGTTSAGNVQKLHDLNLNPQLANHSTHLSVGHPV